MFQKLITRLARRQDSHAMHQGLVVTNSPAYNRQAAAVRRPPYPYMWYYRTEVRNTLDVPLRIVWFEGFSRVWWWWMPNNILRRGLNGDDFGAWYSDGERIVHGVIPPGVTAVNACNWHGSSGPMLNSVKWAFKAVDPAGLEYYAEVILEERWLLTIEA